jgi:hypothetical protein
MVAPRTPVVRGPSWDAGKLQAETQRTAVSGQPGLLIQQLEDGALVDLQKRGEKNNSHDRRRPQ